MSHVPAARGPVRVDSPPVYVAGFLLAHQHVLFVRKRRPDWLGTVFTGLGGRHRPLEPFDAAIERTAARDLGAHAADLGRVAAPWVHRAILVVEAPDGAVDHALWIFTRAVPGGLLRRLALAALTTPDPPAGFDADVAAAAVVPVRNPDDWPATVGYAPWVLPLAAADLTRAPMFHLPLRVPLIHKPTVRQDGRPPRD